MASHIKPPRAGSRVWWLGVFVPSLVLAAGLAFIATTTTESGVLASLAAALGLMPMPVSTAIRASIERSEASRAEIRALNEAAGEGVLVGQVSGDLAGVHLSVDAEFPFVERDIQALVASDLETRRRALIVGSSMSGKTRLALEVVKRRYPEFEYFRPANASSIRALLAKGVKIRRAVIWLDDLDEYLGEDGIRAAELETLLKSEDVVVVATMRASECDKLMPRHGAKSPGWSAIRWFGDYRVLGGWSAQELNRVMHVEGGMALVARAGNATISNFLGGAPLVSRALAMAEAEQSAGYGIVRAAVDWRRVGVLSGLTRELLFELAKSYATVRYSPTELDAGLTWALQRLNGTAALLEVRDDGFSATDIAVDQSSSRALVEIPELVWEKAVASGRELVQVGFYAFGVSLFSIARLAWLKAANAGDVSAIFNLGILEQSLSRSVEAERWYERGAALGDADCMNSLGVLLDRRDETENARMWLSNAAARGQLDALYNLALIGREAGAPSEFVRLLARASAGGHIDAAIHLGLHYEDTDQSAEAEEQYRLAADAGNLEAKNRLGLLLGKRGEVDAAVPVLQEAALRGHKRAAYNLSVVYMMKADCESAERWCRVAAEAGDLDAVDNLGALRLIAGDVKAAKELFRVAAEGGHSNGVQHYVTQLIADGSREAAERVLEAAVARDDGEAVLSLALLKLQGDAREEGMGMLRGVAEGGNPDAIGSLVEALGQRGDFEAAQKWLAQADSGRLLLDFGLLALSERRYDDAANWYAEAEKLDIHPAAELRDLCLLFGGNYSNSLAGIIALSTRVRPAVRNLERLGAHQAPWFRDVWPAHGWIERQAVRCLLRPSNHGKISALGLPRRQHGGPKFSYRRPQFSARPDSSARLGSSAPREE